MSMFSIASLYRMVAAESAPGRWLSSKTPATEKVLLYDKDYLEFWHPDGFGNIGCDAVYLPLKGLLVDNKIVRDVTSHEGFLEKKAYIEERGRGFVSKYTFKATGAVPKSIVDHIAKLFKEQQDINAQIIALNTQRDMNARELAQLSENIRKSVEIIEDQRSQS